MIRKGTDIGEAVRMLRNSLAEKIGISISHLEKIETGARRPGIATFFKILDVLDADIVMREKADTIGQCISKVKDIFLDSTDEQAVFMLSVVECMAEHMKFLVES